MSSSIIHHTWSVVLRLASQVEADEKLGGIQLMDIFLRTRERAQPHTHPSCTVQKHRKTCNMLMNARTRTTKHTSPNVRGQWQECGAGGPCVLSLVYNHPVTSVPLFLLRSLRLFLTQPVESLFPWWGCEVGLLCLALLSRSVKEAPTKRRTFFLLTLLTVTYAAKLPCSLSDYMCNRRRRKAKDSWSDIYSHTCPCFYFMI